MPRLCFLSVEVFGGFRGGADAAVGDLEENGVQRFRPPVQEALAQLTPDVPQELPLIGSLDPFRQGVDLHVMGDFDHRADDLPVQPAAGIQIPDQRHVELDQVDLEAAKDIQRGIAAAEIVQPELVSLLPQVTQLRLEPVGGGGDIPFGDLHDEAVPGDEFLHVILLIQVLDLLGDVPVIKILGSEVDRDRKQRKVGFRADRDLFTGPVCAGGDISPGRG